MLNQSPLVLSLSKPVLSGWVASQSKGTHSARAVLRAGPGGDEQSCR
jgi:hypothetical protein